ncbi:MAG: histidinol-phosphatase [Eubacteriales bacterium]|nr:histidinol-phosphatase [Eubacteriales bacterium]
MEPIMKENYHTHTSRCHHAAGTEREYIETAIARGLTVLGFSDHAPMPFEPRFESGFRMAVEETGEYVSTLRALRDEYADRIRILIGFETEYYPAVFQRFRELIAPFEPDYIIMGQHALGNEYDTAMRPQPPTKDRRILKTYVDQVLEGLETGFFSYIAHPDVINYTPDDEIYAAEMRRLCVRCRELGIPLEVNLLGMRTNRNYPCEKFFRIAAQEGNEVIFGCDAHEPASVAEPGNLAEARRFAEKTGLKVIQRPVLRRPF